MIKIVQKEDCCGCEACVQICPKKCIELLRDTEGFLYPKVNDTQCIECGLCENVCPVLHDPSDCKELDHAYAAYNKQEHVVRKSSSGGVFYALSGHVIEHGGVVFGAVYDEQFAVKHVWTDDIRELEKMQGSKYIQSRTYDSYKQVKSFLQEGRQVLFSGTPCQIKALNLYLKNIDRANLITMDFVCHGVPSPRIWEEYLKTTDLKVLSVNFRDKKNGWEKYALHIEGVPLHCSTKMQKKNLYIDNTSGDNIFMKLFLNNLILRPSCHNCKAKGGRSGSDITVGDFWGIKEVYPQLWKHTGVSLIICNSTESDIRINSDELPLEMSKVDKKTALLHNMSYYNSSKPNPKRSIFFQQIASSGFSIQLAKKILHRNLYNKLMNKICSLLRLK